MKQKELLTVLSLIALVLLSIHIPDDYVHGFDKGVVNNPYGILIFVVWATGVLILRERLIGRIIIFLGGLAAIGMPLIHLRGRGYGEEFLKAEGALRFIWTLYALGTLGALILILVVREMLTSRKTRVRESPTPAP